MEVSEIIDMMSKATTTIKGLRSDRSFLLNKVKELSEIVYKQSAGQYVNDAEVLRIVAETRERIGSMVELEPEDAKVVGRWAKIFTGGGGDAEHKE